MPYQRFWLVLTSNHGLLLTNIGVKLSYFYGTGATPSFSAGKLCPLTKRWFTK